MVFNSKQTRNFGFFFRILISDEYVFSLDTVKHWPNYSLNSELLYQTQAPSSENFHIQNSHMELHLGNVEHFKECRLNHIFFQLCHKLFSGGGENQIQIYCLKLDGGVQKSLKLLQFIIQHNKMRRKDMVRCLSAKLWSAPFGNGVSHYNFLKKPKCHPGYITVF